MTDIRIATFNAENLFARFKFKANIDPKDAVKDGWNAEETAFDIYDEDAKRITGQAIKATGADVIALQEIENLDTLKRFRSQFLGTRAGYTYALSLDGNDPRLIDVAVLSKHPIVHVRSYAHLRHGRSALFSRDSLEADVLVGKKRLTLFVQHFKSMMGGRRETAKRREVQVDAVLEIVKDRFGRSAGREPFVVLGDFNDYMQTDKEGSPSIGGLVDWRQVENVVRRLPEAEQWTHYFARRKKYTQLDYLLLSKALAERSDEAPEIVRAGLPLTSRALHRQALQGGVVEQRVSCSTQGGTDVLKLQLMCPAGDQARLPSPRDWCAPIGISNPVLHVSSSLDRSLDGARVRPLVIGQARSKRSRFMTLSQAARKSRTNLSFESSHA